MVLEAVYLGAERNQKGTQEGARDKTLQKPVLRDLLHLGVPYDLGFSEHTPQILAEEQVLNRHHLGETLHIQRIRPYTNDSNTILNYLCTILVLILTIINL